MMKLHLLRETFGGPLNEIPLPKMAGPKWSVGKITLVTIGVGAVVTLIYLGLKSLFSEKRPIYITNVIPKDIGRQAKREKTQSDTPAEDNVNSEDTE